MIAAAILGLVLLVGVFCFVLGVSGGDLSKWLSDRPSNLTTLLATTAIFAGFILNANQWNAERKSRRRKEFDERIASFHTWKTESAIKLLLNYDRHVALTNEDKEERVTWNDSAEALIPALFREYLFEPKLTAIRDCFNDLIERMSRLHFLLEDGLVDAKNVDHLCKQLIVRIDCDPAFSTLPLARNFRLYLLWRKSEGALKMFQRYNCDPSRHKDDDIAALKQDIAKGIYGRCKPNPDWGSL